MAEKGTKKLDCFAYNEIDSRIGGFTETVVDCTALKKMLCANGECPFYKNIDQHREELMKMNGTVSMAEICKDYEERVSRVTANGQQ